MKNTVLISGTSNPAFAKALARGLRVPMIDVHVKQFQDGETYVNVGSAQHDVSMIRGKHVLIVQAGAPCGNAMFLELLLIIDAVKRLQPKKVTVVLSFYPYRRQERKVEAGEAISASVIAQCIVTAGADAVVHVELHVEKIREFFSIPSIHVRTDALFIRYFEKMLEKRRKRMKRRFVWQGDPWVVVAPDLGSRSHARAIADRLNLAFVQTYKHRHEHDAVQIDMIRGAVDGKNVIIIDDEIDTGNTMTENAIALERLGARKIYIACTHPVFVNHAVKRLTNIRSLEQIVVTDTIAHPEFSRAKKIKVLSVVPLLVDALKRKYA